MGAGSILFKPYIVQAGPGPHLFDFAYATGEDGNPFRSDIAVGPDGVSISDTQGVDRFAIHVRWNVEGFGFLFLRADHGGEYYQLSSSGRLTLNLNYELALSWVERNRRRYATFRKEGWIASRELKAYLDVSEGYFDETQKVSAEEARAQLAPKALRYALLASDYLEIEKADYDIRRNGVRPEFLFGCDTRGFFKMERELFLDRFTELFNYATITFYLIGDITDFEPEEGNKRYTERDAVLRELLKRDITVEGRPLFWTHAWVTPEWLKAKSYGEALAYLQQHVKEVVGHYGNDLAVWEVVNELHDWANELELNHEQTIELTRIACEVARDTNPDAKLLINTCCPFAEYIQEGKWHERNAKYPQRSPHQFIAQLLDARVDFDIIGVQKYFTKRPIAASVEIIESFAEFGKEVHLAEVGCPSRGITQEFIDEEDYDPSLAPYEWLRHWDETLQADWLEAIFSFAYSKPWITAANWYDFVDPIGFLKNGGLMRSLEGERKVAFERLRQLRERWGKLPARFEIDRNPGPHKQ